LNRFIDFGGMTTFPGPYDCAGTKLWGWFAEADHAKLDALCREVFAGATGGAIDYRPLGQYVMVTFGDIANVRPVPEPYHSMGVLDETQAAIWVPVVRVEDEGGRPTAVSLSFWVPFIWLANAMSFATGREGAGWAKTWGVPTMPASQGDPQRFSLDVFGMDYSPTSRPAMHTLLTVEPVGPATGERKEYDSIADIARHVGPHLFGHHGQDPDPEVHYGWRFDVSLLHDAIAHGLPEVFLKQSRSAHDGTQADLQEVVTSQATVRALHGAGLEQEHQLTVNHLDTHDLGGQLGLETQTLQFGYYVEMDFVQEVGVVAWPPGG
jgi:hypothetical protein